jgi:hypothetical protein
LLQKIRKRVLLAVILAITLCPTPSHAQGCTQCRDNTAATPPATQAAYRHAILLMVITAGGLFLTTLIILKRQR